MRMDTARWEYVYVAAGKKFGYQENLEHVCCGGVEDVKHVLCACPVYANERKTLLKHVEMMRSIRQT